MPNFILRSTK